MAGRGSLALLIYVLSSGAALADEAVPPDLARAVDAALALPALVEGDDGSPCPGAERPERPRIEITLRLRNDQTPRSPLNGRGDDLGYTHGYAVSVDLNREDLTRITILLSNDLFTRRTEAPVRDGEGGVRIAPQNFTEEVKLLVRWDTESQGRLLYVRAGAGMHVLDSRVGQGPLSPAVQQTAWHHLVNVATPVRFYEREQIADGQGLRPGALIEGHVGLQPRLLRFDGRAGEVELRLHAGTGFEASTHLGASQWITDAGARLESAGPRLPVVGRPRINGSAGATVRAHAAGGVLEPHVEVSMGTDLVEAGGELRSFHGTLPNHALYNAASVGQAGGNDDIAGVFVRARF